MRLNSQALLAGGSVCHGSRDHIRGARLGKAKPGSNPWDARTGKERPSAVICREGFGGLLAYCKRSKSITVGGRALLVTGELRLTVTSVFDPLLGPRWETPGFPGARLV